MLQSRQSQKIDHGTHAQSCDSAPRMAESAYGARMRRKEMGLYQELIQSQSFKVPMRSADRKESEFRIIESAKRTQQFWLLTPGF